MSNLIPSKDPIQGLIDYILDIKPYHTKIAEVGEDYVAEDLVRVTVLDQMNMEGVFVEDYDEDFACENGFGVNGFGDQDFSIFYQPDTTINGFITLSGESAPRQIIYVNPFNGSFIISGNHVAAAPSGSQFTIDNSYANDGTWEVTSATHEVGSPVSVLVLFTNLNASVIGGNQGLKQFWFANDLTSQFVVGYSLTIYGSTGNDGTYHVASSTYDGPSNTTKLTVVEVIPTGTFDGVLAWLQNGTIALDVTEIVATFQGPFATELPIVNVNITTLQFKINGPFGNNYDPGDSFQVINSTQSYQNGNWLINSQTNPTYPIGLVNSGAKKLIVTGVNVTSSFTSGDLIFVEGTLDSTQGTLADRSWIVASVAFVLGNTEITVQDASGQPLIDPDINNGFVRTNYFLVNTSHIFHNDTQGLVNPFVGPVLNLPITKVNTTAGIFFVPGNHLIEFPVASFFTVSQTPSATSTGNQGKWQVTAVSFDNVNILTRITGTYVSILPLVGPVDGDVSVYARSNWDLPEICHDASQTNVSSFIGEELEFILGSEINLSDSVNVEVCDLTGSVGWGAGGGTVNAHIAGGNQGLKQFFVAYDFTASLTTPSWEPMPGSHPLLQVINSTGNNGTYNITAVNFNIGLNITEITVAESIPSAAFNGTLTYQSTITIPGKVQGWDDCGWDTQAEITAFQYKVDPTFDIFTSYDFMGGQQEPHGFEEGDKVTVSGALPLPATTTLPSGFLSVNTPYSVHVVSPTTFQLNLVYDVIGVDVPSGTWTLIGQHATEFTVGSQFTISDSGGGDGNYIVLSRTDNVLNNTTEVVVTGAIPAGTVGNGTFTLHIDITTTGNTDYQFVEQLNTFITMVRSRTTGSDDGANTSITEQLTIIDSYDYQAWDQGSWDETDEQLPFLYIKYPAGP